MTARLREQLRVELDRVADDLERVPARVDELAARWPDAPRDALELGTLREARGWTVAELRSILRRYLAPPQRRRQGER